MENVCILENMVQNNIRTYVLHMQNFGRGSQWNIIGEKWKRR